MKMETNKVKILNVEVNIFAWQTQRLEVGFAGIVQNNLHIAET